MIENLKMILLTRGIEKETTTSQRSVQQQGSHCKVKYSKRRVLMIPNQAASAAHLLRLQLSCHSALPAGEDGELRENKVRSMATQLLAKFEENSSTVQNRNKVRTAIVYVQTGGNACA